MRHFLITILCVCLPSSAVSFADQGFTASSVLDGFPIKTYEGGGTYQGNGQVVLSDDSLTIITSDYEWQSTGGVQIQLASSLAGSILVERKGQITVDTTEEGGNLVFQFGSGDEFVMSGAITLTYSERAGLIVQVDDPTVGLMSLQFSVAAATSQPPTPRAPGCSCTSAALHAA